MTALTSTPQIKAETYGLFTTNERFAVGVTAVGATVLGLLFPAVAPVGTALVVIGLADITLDTLVTTVRERRLRANILEVFFVSGLLILRVDVLAATSLTGYGGSFWLLRVTQDRTSRRIAERFSEQVTTANRVRLIDGQEEIVETSVHELQVGDVVRVYTGQVVPIDGTIVAGTAMVDQQQLTGESRLLEFGAGEPILGSVLVRAGTIDIRVEETGADILAAKIERILEQTLDYRLVLDARAQTITDATVVPTLTVGAIGTLLLNPVAGFDIVNSNHANTMRAAMSLGLLTYLDSANTPKLLIKDGRAVESLNFVDTVIFDKTGTLTYAQPTVRIVHAFADVTTEELLGVAAAMEMHQDHPVARAILQAAHDRATSPQVVNDLQFESGSGLQARWKDHNVALGSARLMRMQGVTINAEAQAIEEGVAAQGLSLVYLAIDGQLAGLIELEPQTRPGAAEVVATLQARGLDVVMLTGDSRAAAEYLAGQLGIRTVISEVLPQDKGRIVDEWQQAGRQVCFVGDGINDAVALKTARLSISMKSGTALAADVAQVILLDDDLQLLPALFRVANAYRIDLWLNAGIPMTATVASMIGVFVGIVNLTGVYVIYLGGLATVLLNIARVRVLPGPALRSLAE